MSRIGKQPVTLPTGVTASLKGNSITVKGKKGELSFAFDDRMVVTIEEKDIIITRKSDEKEDRSLHGLTRSLIQNMVTGVTEGFEKHLEINGVGYRAQVSGKKLSLSLGFSHPVDLEVPEGLTVALEDKTKNLIISGIDKQRVGQFSAEIRSLRKPEPYKGKGIRYVGEYVKRKAGKTAAK